MVQDPGLGGELYPAMNADGTKLFMYGMEDGASDVSVSVRQTTVAGVGSACSTSSLSAGRQAEDYSKLRERQLYYVVNVPGETAWAKEVSCVLSGNSKSAC